MYYFKNNLNRDELDIMHEVSIHNDNNIKLLREFSGECYIWLTNNGDLYNLYKPDDLFNYQECFGKYHSFYSGEEYKFLKCTPSQIIKYYFYYIVKTVEFPNEWYRGEMQENRNILMEVYADSLEEIINSL